MTSTIMQGAQDKGQWSQTKLLEPDNEHYKSLLCPRHPPLGRPRYSLVFPPELLIDILLETSSEYLDFLFITETRDEEEIEERLAANPFPAILHVSQQFREIASKIIRDAFGVRRESDGCLPKDAWGCLRYILKYVHLLRRGTTELVKEYVKGEESRMVPPMLNNYMRVARLVCTIRPKLWVVMKELGYAHEDERRTLMECRINGALRHALVHYESAVDWCFAFRRFTVPLLPFVPLWTPPEDKDAPDITLRICYSLWSLIPGKMVDGIRGTEPLVTVPISLLDDVNADLLVRYKFLAVLWQYHKLPIVASHKVLQEMSQELLGMCVKISMPHRKPPVSEQGSRRRRVSFSEFQDINDITRSSFELHPEHVTLSALLTSCWARCPAVSL